jgi:hypothetical protein
MQLHRSWAAWASLMAATTYVEQQLQHQYLRYVLWIAPMHSTRNPHYTAAEVVCVLCMCMLPNMNMHALHPTHFERRLTSAQC